MDIIVQGFQAKRYLETFPQLFQCCIWRAVLPFYEHFYRFGKFPLFANLQRALPGALFRLIPGLCGFCRIGLVHSPVTAL